MYTYISGTLHWRHNDQDGVSNHQPHGCLLNRLFGRRSKKTSKLRVTGLCARWIPRTKGQWRGKCFHLMTSSWDVLNVWWRSSLGICIWYYHKSKTINQRVTHLSNLMLFHRHMYHMYQNAPDCRQQEISLNYIEISVILPLVYFYIHMSKLTSGSAIPNKSVSFV